MDTETQTDDTTPTETQATSKKAKAEAAGTRRSILMMDPDDLVIVGLDTEDGPEHYLYDERIKLPLDEQMVRNIMAFGVIQPIVGVKDGDKSLVNAGRRRVTHAREAKRRQLAQGLDTVKVPVVFRRGEEATLFGVSRAENAIRVNDTPMTNARNAQRMLDMGSSEADIAVAFGVKASTVKDWFALLGLAPKIRAAVDKGQLPSSAAVSLAALPKADQEAHLEELLKSGIKPTYENVTQKVRKTQGKAVMLTPRARIEKAEGVILKAVEAGLSKLTKDELLETIDKISKALLSKGTAKLAAEAADAE